MLDSPHSGTRYPESFKHACPREQLRLTEDSYVDELFSGAVSLGIPLLSATFPRCFIDANRAEDDIDPLLFETPWPGAQPTSRSGLGVGLVRRLLKQNSQTPIYAGPIAHDEVKSRIENYYRPYHNALESLLNGAFDAFGTYFHLNCHSMPDQNGGAARLAPDIVLGDRDGTTCTPMMTRFVQVTLRNMGYRVAINSPYKGVELVRKFGTPAQNRHSLQIEISRALYMDERSREKTEGFARLQRDMTQLVRQLIVFTTENSVDLAAD